MRKIKKTAKPDILAKNASKWTKEYCDCLAAGNKPSKEVANRYNEPTIKSALEKETHGKCVYCESKIKHISYGDIEHILPKNKDARPDLYVEWSNLTLSCEQCNRSGKRTYFDPELPLVNPYEDEPAEFLMDLGAIIMPWPGNDRGIVTEAILKLNRSELVERRMDRINKVSILLTSWVKENNPTLKKIMADQLRQEYTEDKEYSSTVKAYLTASGFPVLSS